jgi:hypothetical protein
MRSLHGKRLTYKALIGALEDAPASNNGMDENGKNAGKENLPN